MTSNQSNGLLPAIISRFRIREVRLLRRLAWVVVVLSHSLRADTLIYHNGDKIAGTLLSKEDDGFVFASENFGTIRVKETNAAVEINGKLHGTFAPEVAVGVPASAPSKPRPDKVAVTDNSHDESFQWLAPWTGRIAVALEMVQETESRDSVVLDLRLKREWPSDELQFESRYEYKRNAGQKSADLLKGAGSWRHDVGHRYFGLYRSTAEWNRYSYYNGRFTPYFLLQQEIGVGKTLLKNSDRSLRLGISENVFNVWVKNLHIDRSKTIESGFLEVGLKLPGGLKLTERGVLFYSVTGSHAGEENTLELNKRLGKSMSLGLSHDYRHNLPDVRVQNYRNLRLLLGFDF